MKKTAKTISNAAIIKELKAEIAHLKQEIRLLKNPYNQIEDAIKRFNRFLREIVHEDFFYWVEIQCTGEIKIYYLWDQAEASDFNCISEHYLSMAIELLKKVNWQAEIERDFEGRSKKVLFDLKLKQAGEESELRNAYETYCKLRPLFKAGVDLTAVQSLLNAESESPAPEPCLSNG